MADDFDIRFGAAKKHRQEFIRDAAREAYLFCFNGREGEWDDKPRKDQEPEEIFTDLPATIAEEFNGELFSTMTPENAPWVEYEAGNPVDEKDANTASEDMKDFEKAIDKAIRISNYYDEGQTVFQDAAIGTVCSWIDKPTLHGPAVVRALPLSQCYLRLGMNGVEDRFFREHYCYYDLPVLFPRATFPREIQKKVDKKDSGKACVVWGFWRDYSDPANPQWRQAIRVDDKDIGLDKITGPDGSIPMVVGRFNPVPGSAYGRGPAIRMRPAMFVLNEVSRMILEGMDRVLDPAVVYPHDGILDLSEGIEAGMGYPAMPGSAESIRELGLSGNMDAGFYTEERLEQILRYGFYREVVQKGKTPPSATQFMADEQKQVRRMARPAAKLWREYGVGVLKRFEWLERQPGGSLTGKKSMIESGKLIVRPISPLERAQAREEVLVAQSIMGMAKEGLGEQQAGLLIDGPKTITNIRDKLKDKLVEVRTENQIAAILQAMQPQAPDAAQ